MLPPARPTSIASRMVSATASGWSPYRASRSPLPGISTAAVIWRTRSYITARETGVAPPGTAWSAFPSEKAMPALVVAIAAKPASASTIALPASQALGITKPGRLTWSRQKVDAAPGPVTLLLTGDALEEVRLALRVACETARQHVRLGGH